MRHRMRHRIGDIVRVSKETCNSIEFANYKGIEGRIIRESSSYDWEIVWDKDLDCPYFYDVELRLVRRPVNPPLTNPCAEIPL